MKISCSYCGRLVSEDRESCPFCAGPVPNSVKDTQVGLDKNKPEIWKRLKKVFVEETEDIGPY